MAKASKNSKALATQQSVDQVVYGICDILRRSGRASALQYIPELTWILFLRILDERENNEAQRAAIMGLQPKHSIAAPYRWQDWAAPGAPLRAKLQKGRTGALKEFLEGNDKEETHPDYEPGLFHYMHTLKDGPNVTPRQKIISQILSHVTQFNLDSEYDMWEVIDRVHQIHDSAIDKTHIFPISQAFEGLLLRMGETNNDGGQFFTPRVAIRMMIHVLDPQVGETQYDPGSGTGGFHAQSYEHMTATNHHLSASDLETLKLHTFYGCEKDDTIYPIALANLVLHGIDHPNLLHGNTLTGQIDYAGLFQNAPARYNIIATNPPFGGKESKQAQTNFAFKTGATQILFWQHVMDKLADAGRCGIVLDEGALFRTNETAFVQTKRKLLNEFNVWCIVSLPGGVFTSAGAGVKTNIIFFNEGGPTEKIWYYDLSHIKIGKRKPLTDAHFDHFFQVMPTRADSDYSWTIDINARKAQVQAEAAPYREQAQASHHAARDLEARWTQAKKQHGATSAVAADLSAQLNAARKAARDLDSRAQAIEDSLYDLKAVNPNSQSNDDERTPDQLIAIIEAKGQEVAAALAELKAIT